MRLAVSVIIVGMGVWDPGSGIRDPGSAADIAWGTTGVVRAAMSGDLITTRKPGIALGHGSPFPDPGSRIPDPRSRTPDPGSHSEESAQRPLGSIRGRVDIRRVVLAPERRPDVAGLSSQPARELPDTRRAVVFLETAPAGAFDDRDPRPARMDQRNETFLPHVLAVDEGTVVDFPNNDSTYHNVFSLSKPKRFDLGRYARGRSRSVRFDRPGIVRVFCDIHSHMSAFVLVFSHPYYASTESDGRYRIDGVPPGTYMVSAWHEGSTRDTRTVTIPPQGGPVDLDFVVQ